MQAKDFDGTVVVWLHPGGKSSLWQDGKLTPAAQQVLDKKAAILAPDVLLTGEFAGAKPMPINAQYAGYTFGYNRSLLANRVHDILTVVAFAKGHKQRRRSTWSAGRRRDRGCCSRERCAATRWRARQRTAMQLRFQNVRTTDDEMMLPGALKYGGLPAFAALCAPAELYVHNHHSERHRRVAEAGVRCLGQTRQLAAPLGEGIGGESDRVAFALTLQKARTPRAAA